MATYLCVKVNNTTKKFTAKESKEAGKPYLRVPGGYFPLTTETTTGTQLKVRANNTNYRIVETYTTTINTTTNTTTTVQAQSTSNVTSKDPYVPYEFYEMATIDGYIPYKATYTYGTYDSEFGVAALIIIKGNYTKSNTNYTSFYYDITTYNNNSRMSTSKTGIIYYNSTKLLNGYRIQAHEKNLMIISSNDQASIYNSKNINTSTFYMDVPIDKKIYVGQNAKIKGTIATMSNYTLYNQNNIAFSTENYTYETISNTIVNTTIETTSQ